MYKITLKLKTKSKVIFECETTDELFEKIKMLGLFKFTKGFVFTHIDCFDSVGHNYLITEYSRLNLLKSPEELFNKLNGM